MNARIERDYRDLYRLALSLQRRADRSEGEVKVLRALKGKYGTGEGARAVEALDKVREREDRLWGAVDRVSYALLCLVLGYGLRSSWGYDYSGLIGLEL